MIDHENDGWSAVMVRTERGQRAVKDAIAARALIARSISDREMLHFNEHLLITPSHPRHSWIQLYRLIFLKQLRLLPGILRRLCEGKLVGLVTTLRARLARQYYY
jgi:hypothetical protein